MNKRTDRLRQLRSFQSLLPTAYCLLLALPLLARGAGESPQPVIDDARLAADGIRKLSGKHLILYTDVPPSPQIEILPAVFDQAFPQWCQYFHVSARDHADWRVVGCLVRDKPLFIRCGLMPENLPVVHQGYFAMGRLWVFDQSSDYYRRHLLLHEGTHAFMTAMLAGTGPPWYAEGTAELLGTHRWLDGRLTLGYMPQSREEVPQLGRVRLVQEAVAARRAKHLQTVLDFPAQALSETEAYGWCWAAAALLDMHPRYRDRFRTLYRFAAKGEGLNEELHRLFAGDWQPLSEEWQLFVVEMEYGYDFARSAIDFAPGAPLPAGGPTVRVAADRGWQNSGWRLERGVKYRLTASGRYQVGTQPQPWWCEPAGVSIRYYHGRPLGVLLAAVRSDEHHNGSTGLVRPMVIGLGATVVPEQTGTLYLKINHSPGELAGNSGSLAARVETEPTP
jgi:hypothetical protein